MDKKGNKDLLEKYRFIIKLQENRLRIDSLDAIQREQCYDVINYYEEKIKELER